MKELGTEKCICEREKEGCRHSSVVSSAPTILRPRVRHTLLKMIVFMVIRASMLTWDAEFFAKCKKLGLFSDKSY